eukprot:675173-Amphidinium_carterae.1
MPNARKRIQAHSCVQAVVHRTLEISKLFTHTHTQGCSSAAIDGPACFGHRDRKDSCFCLAIKLLLELPYSCQL